MKELLIANGQEVPSGESNVRELVSLLLHLKLVGIIEILYTLNFLVYLCMVRFVIFFISCLFTYIKFYLCCSMTWLQ